MYNAYTQFKSRILEFVILFIIGNSFAPEILSVNVNERIPENTKFGVIVATVSASDRDTQFPDNDIRFQMFASQLASEFFAVDSLMGNIFVKKDLTLDTSKIYQVQEKLKFLNYSKII